MKRCAVALIALSLVAGCGTSLSGGGRDTDSETDELRERLEDLEAEVADAEADRRGKERCDSIRDEYEAREPALDVEDPDDLGLIRQKASCDVFHP